MCSAVAKLMMVDGGGGANELRCSEACVWMCCMPAVLTTSYLLCRSEWTNNFFFKLDILKYSYKVKNNNW